MNGADRTWLLGAAIALTLALLASAWEWKRWTTLRRSVPGDALMATTWGVPNEVALADARLRLDAIRNRLPAANSTASRRAQQAVLDLMQRHGVEITDVAPKADAASAKHSLPGCPGWPGMIMELRGRTTFPAVAAILAALPHLDAVVIPVEVELLRGAKLQAHSVVIDPDVLTPTAMPPEDRRIQVRLVLAL